MLPAQSRLRDRRLLALTVKRGTRVSRRYVVIHFLPPDPRCTTDSGAKVGFAVSKAVGGSVVRHRVVRRLRHVIAGRLNQLPAGSSVVVRALPPSASATSADLAQELEALLPRVAGVRT